MWWPLRYQIMLPMAAVILLTVVGLSVLNAYVAANRATAEIEQRLQSVAQTLADSTFPLTDSVLSQMRGLAGADFVLLDETGKMQAASQENLKGIELAATQNSTAKSVRGHPALQFAQPLQIDGREFLHAILDVRQPENPVRLRQLHVLYPDEAYRDVWWQAVRPPLAIGGISLLIVVVLGTWIAARVSQPLSRLREQVEQIAEGHFEPVPTATRRDEVRDLAMAVNVMAKRLSQYEEQVRVIERLRTLGQLGGGLVHQLRNSATGARMAIDIHRQECLREDACESLDVATRQLELMERYLQKFLALGGRQDRQRHLLDMAALVGGVVQLVGPAARHAQVELEVSLPNEPQWIEGEADGLEHLILNLLLNAMEAAAASRHSHDLHARVALSLSATERDSLLIRVSDSGAGPSVTVRDKLFEAFVTDKPDGTGLGLAVAKEVVERHLGTIEWSREEGVTQFLVELPLSAVGSSRVEVASR